MQNRMALNQQKQALSSAFSGRFSRMLLKKRYLIPLLASLLVFMVRLEMIEVENPTRDQARLEEYLVTLYGAGIPEAERKLVIETIVAKGQDLEVPYTFRIDGRKVNRTFLLAAYIKTESNFRRYARSTSDARGYMQVKPMTAAWLDQRSGRPNRVEQMYDTRLNINYGVEYLNYLMTEVDDPRLAALSYNMGPNNVKRGYFEEQYWRKILHVYRQLQSGSFRNRPVR
ncbi:MAG: lytic transglycosylase domain-containing protein [Leptospiraceae bacterium]|nr:lytic transglycosylase domain-containing protein [Leptospiraceae bacterium]MCB1314850.1 lytic transglycosylase domain-containing protein [Leptospiraceae bacterium]MCB1321981.1 lytic transglycosylase domain-containing protein [Leptospiraceae bacterium]